MKSEKGHWTGDLQPDNGDRQMAEGAPHAIVHHDASRMVDDWIQSMMKKQAAAKPKIADRPSGNAAPKPFAQALRGLMAKIES